MRPLAPEDRAPGATLTAMTLEGESGAAGSTVCPFVAFADDRDLRAATPDHRHRCYAETPAAPRALAHQARYCLSSDFASCPIFQDWASREAARVSDEPLTGAAAAGGVAAGAAAAASAANPPSAGGAMPQTGPGFFDELRASAERSTPAPSARPIAPPPVPAGRAGPEEPDEDEEDEMAAAPVRDWDRPRARRDYPRLERQRRVSRTLLGVAALAVAALLLFLLPSLLRGLFGGGGEASPTPGVSASASASPSGSLASESPTESGATPNPSASQLTYTVVSGDTLTKIATKFHTTVQAILAANPSITNPNNITVGQVIVIPTGASPSPSG